MHQAFRAGSLSWWAGPGQDLGLAIDAVLSHPELGAGVQALARGMLDLAVDDPNLLAIFKDAGRYSAAMWAFHLHESGGLTLAGLRELCATSGLQSAGRVRGVLQFLQHLGYVARRPDGGRTPAYTVTAAFAAAWERQLRAALAAAAVLAPQVGEVLVGAEPHIVRRFGSVHAQGVLAVTSEDDGASLPRILRVFLHAHAGSQILWTLLSSSEGAAFPPSVAGPVSAAGLASRFKVSRVQVKRVFAAAEREGLAQLDAEGMLRFTADAQQEIRFLYAVQLVMILQAAGRTAEVFNLLASPAPA